MKLSRIVAQLKSHGNDFDDDLKFTLIADIDNTELPTFPFVSTSKKTIFLDIISTPNNLFLTLYVICKKFSNLLFC